MRREKQKKKKIGEIRIIRFFFLIFYTCVTEIEKKKWTTIEKKSALWNVFFFRFINIFRISKLKKKYHITHKSDAWQYNAITIHLDPRFLEPVLFAVQHHLKWAERKKYVRVKILRPSLIELFAWVNDDVVSSVHKLSRHSRLPLIIFTRRTKNEPYLHYT